MLATEKQESLRVSMSYGRKTMTGNGYRILFFKIFVIKCLSLNVVSSGNIMADFDLLNSCM